MLSQLKTFLCSGKRVPPRVIPTWTGKPTRLKTTTFRVNVLVRNSPWTRLLSHHSPSVGSVLFGNEQEHCSKYGEASSSRQSLAEFAENSQVKFDTGFCLTFTCICIISVIWEKKWRDSLTKKKGIINNKKNDKRAEAGPGLCFSPQLCRRSFSAEFHQVWTTNPNSGSHPQKCIWKEKTTLEPSWRTSLKRPLFCPRPFHGAAPPAVRILRGPTVLHGGIFAAPGHGHALYLARNDNNTLEQPAHKSQSASTGALVATPTWFRTGT